MGESADQSRDDFKDVRGLEVNVRGLEVFNY